MDITDAVTTEHASFDPSTRVSKLRGAFSEERLSNAILVAGNEVEGVIPRKELLDSHHDPGEKLQSVVRSPPRISRTEDVRETARLMVESELKLLPVYEGSQFHGVITDHAVLDLVLENLDTLSVQDVFTRDLISVEPDTSLGRVINVLRENDISRVPVIDEEEEAVGLVSVFDLVEFIVRKMHRNQDGAPDGFDGHGGSGTSHRYRTHSGFGERVGESARMLDLPARDVMSTPVYTVDREESLEEAVEEILDTEYSSLVVTASDGRPTGIMTTTDVLRVLTVDEQRHMDIQVFGVEHLYGLSRADIATRIEEIDHKYQNMNILEANVVFHEHREQQRGTPLLLVTVRLFTDEGRFVGSAEEYGAPTAFKEAAAVAEGNALEDKSRKHPRERRNRSAAQAQELLNWWHTAE